ncbi:tetratricopeptide repeat protein [Denitromonas ohlonensis]|uniref:Sel1 repeat family protein n=2 Tax=Denitromonas TaxID=139331 RepID=A0A557RIN8_9RHOO|nr:tetratricopeptide repeat protein [Denitromonas ohlonensis]TVO65031.1 sel1 repeat family protein [Denitromonas ohlonensis]TVO75704.1 sel1 repeat family protein [Denitromonas ohlonensis]TVT44958.1 MAG: sel1 repeat family protein [Denitromonas halophila]
MRSAAALSLALACAPAAAVLDEDTLADIVSRPSTGLYKGYAEFKMAHYAEARQIWTALAERGVAEAWFNLGLLAEDGLGEAQDAVRALMCYTRGAEGGSSKAQYRLAQLYLEGRLVAADPARAEHWLARAAALGDDGAAAQLAALRRGVPDDPYLAARRLESTGEAATAAQHYARLSDTGDLRARTRLAWLYEAGRGVPRDLARAADLFESAARGGEAEAQFALSVMLRTGVGRAQDLAAADAWLAKAVAAGYPEAVSLQHERDTAPTLEETPR